MTEVRCKETFTKQAGLFELTFHKGTVYEVKEANGIELIGISIFNIDFSKVSSLFEPVEPIRTMHQSHVH